MPRHEKTITWGNQTTDDVVRASPAGVAIRPFAPSERVRAAWTIPIPWTGFVSFKCIENGNVGDTLFAKVLIIAASGQAFVDLEQDAAFPTDGTRTIIPLGFSSGQPFVTGETISVLAGYRGGVIGGAVRKVECYANVAPYGAIYGKPEG